MLGLLAINGAYAAILNCNYELDGYCYECKAGYEKRQSNCTYGQCVGNENITMGEECVRYCNDYRHVETLCDTNGTTSTASHIRTNYTNKYAGNCYDEDGNSQSMLTFCSNNYKITCVKNAYGGGWNNTSCTSCPQMTSPKMYTNKNLFTDLYLVRGVTTSSGTTSVSGCYIATGTYYDATGTISVTATCPYK